MARISEFEQSSGDSIEIAISQTEYGMLGTGPGQLKLRVGTFTKDGEEFEVLDVSANQADWILDPDTGEYVHTLVSVDGNHSVSYQAIVLGSVDTNGDAIEIYDAYMIGNYSGQLDPSAVDEVKATNSWVPQGTPFTDILQSSPQPSQGGNNEATLRWDSPDHINDPVAQRDSSLNDTGDGMPCFVRGAIVETPQGGVRIETLKAGDLVRTRDNGFQPLRWVGYGRINAQTMASDMRRYPVRVRAGSLGENTPARECYFSRQHRILIATSDNPEGVLIPVKDLIGLPGIELADNWEGHVDYFHMLFDRHEIVFTDNMQSESLLLTNYSFSLLGWMAKIEIMSIVSDPRRMIASREILQGKTGTQSSEQDRCHRFAAAGSIGPYIQSALISLN